MDHLTQHICCGGGLFGVYGLLKAGHQGRTINNPGHDALGGPRMTAKAPPKSGFRKLKYQSRKPKRSRRGFGGLFLI